MAYSTRAVAGRLVRTLFATFAVFVLAAAARATIGAALQMQLGNPSSATTDSNNHSHYLIQRDQYAMDYDDTTREPNWVSWDLTTEDVGSSGRSNFIQDTTLPAGFYQVLTTDYSGSGYDRGHMCPSADRTVTVYDNQQLFYMSNMVPQSPDNNQGVWANFESYCRSLASGGNEVLITCGPSGFGGSTIASGVAIPGYTWKIAVVVPRGAGTALDRINASTRVIAIKVPNIAGVRSTPWQNFVTSAAQIEADTGYTFFSALPTSVANALRLEVDGQTAVGAPSIVAQPVNQTTVVGGSATFSVTASGDAPLSYQWLKDDDEIAGATNASFTVSGVGASDVGSYDVVVSNNVGSVTSSSASLIVMGLAPSITASPESQTVSAGSSVTFAVTAAGSPVLSYQWRKDLTPVPFATSSTLTLPDVQSGDIASYDVVVTNSVGSATSAAAHLVVNPAAPSITAQPAAQNPTLGGNASFTVGAAGTEPLSYQWRKAGVPLADGGVVSGATTATLTLSGVSAVDAANYDVVVTNSLSSATSNPAALTVSAPPPAAISWNFSSASPSSNATPDVTAGDVTQQNNNGTTTMITSSSVSSGYAGASGTFNAGAAARTGALVTGTGGSAYFEFTLTPTAGKRLVLNGLQFGARSTSTGPQAYAIFSSLDGFAAPFASGALSNNSSWSLKVPSFASLTGATDASVTLRIYGYNGTGSASAGTANWRIDDLTVTASTVYPPPVAPLVASTIPAAGATNVDVAAPITVTFNEAVSFTGSWFSISSAANGATSAAVTGGPTTFTITPPSNFAYSDTITLTVFGAKVVDQATGTIHGAGNTSLSFTTGGYVPPTPPTVTQDPQPQSVVVGADATFTVAATGTAPLSYQWRKNGAVITGNASASTDTLTLTSVGTIDMGNYDCVVSNVAGSDISHGAALNVTIVPPSITTQPTSQIVSYGGGASFTTAAAGTAPLTYRWRHNGTPLTDGNGVAGASTATLSITGATLDDNGTYDVIVTNAASSVPSATATLAVVDSPSVVYWDFGTADPANGIPADVTGGTVTQGNNNGTTALLTTTSASGSYAGSSGGNNAGAAARIGALNQGTAGSAYFEFTFTPTAGRQLAVTSVSFGMRSTGTGPQAFAVYSSADNFTAPVAADVVPNNSSWRLYTPAFAGVVGAAGQPVTFRLYGYNGSGNPGANTANWRVDDLKVTLGVLTVPVTITTAPQAQTVTVGDPATFGVSATGSAPFTYQWRKAGAAIDGATNATLTLPNVVTADAGSYDVIVGNIVGSVTSAPAQLNVNKAAAVVTLSGLTATYTGQSVAAVATTNPGGLAVTLTYDGNATAPVNAGSYAVSATIVDANYTGSTTGTLVISPATAQVALGNLLQTYDGAPKSASATTVPAGLSVALTYDGAAAAPIGAGSYAVGAQVTDPNFVGAASGTLVVAKAPAGIVLGNTIQTYDGTPKSVSVVTAPAGLTTTVTYNGLPTPPTAAGTYDVVVTVNTANYTGTASGTLTIGRAVATLTLTGLTQAYDGTAKSVTVTSSPSGLPVTVTYAGSANAPTYPGQYAVVATASDANHTATASGTLTITVTGLVRHAPVIDGAIDGSLQVLTGEAFTLNGNAWLSGDVLVPGTPNVRINGHPTFAGLRDAGGAATPAGYSVTLNGRAVLRYLVQHTDPLTLPAAVTPADPTGNRTVLLFSARQDPGDFASIRNLAMVGNVGSVTVPPGNYGTFAAAGNGAFVLGVPGATEPSVYNFTAIALADNSRIVVVGPVVINLAIGMAINGDVGASGHPEWLTVNIASGGLILNGNVEFDGSVVAPTGTVILNGHSTLSGHVTSDRLIINGGAALQEP